MIVLSLRWLCYSGNSSRFSLSHVREPSTWRRGISFWDGERDHLFRVLGESTHFRLALCSYFSTEIYSSKRAAYNNNPHTHESNEGIIDGRRNGDRMSTSSRMSNICVERSRRVGANERFLSHGGGHHESACCFAASHPSFAS